jgi:YggT family protein
LTSHLITNIVFTLASYALSFLIWSILLSALLSLLLAFNILDRRNRFVWSLADFFGRVSDPILQPIRRRVPLFNGIDLSPWIALVLLQVVGRYVLAYLYAGIVTGAWGSLF